MLQGSELSTGQARSGCAVGQERFGNAPWGPLLCMQCKSGNWQKVLLSSFRDQYPCQHHVRGPVPDSEISWQIRPRSGRRPSCHASFATASRTYDAYALVLCWVVLASRQLAQRTAATCAQPLCRSVEIHAGLQAMCEGHQHRCQLRACPHWSSCCRCFPRA
jgi:hypothetical protein